MPFCFTQKVLFKHCDPAGIVFYPRYFEMINDTVEAFFDAALGCPLEILLKTGGIPTAQITASFIAPSRHGDVLNIKLCCKRLGRSSLDITLEAICNEKTRLKAESTLVYIDLSGRSTAWPEHLRVAIDAQLQEDA